MERQNCIVVIDHTSIPEVFGNFKKACKSRLLPYHSLKMLKFPIIFNGLIIFKVKYN